MTVKRICPKPLDKALLSSIFNDLRQPFKAKSVRDWEAKQARKVRTVASQSGTFKRALKGLMTKNFNLRDLVYNRETKENGTVRRVYETNGASMYEVAVPRQSDSWVLGYDISDWAEGVLQHSTNDPLKASTFKVASHL